MSVPRSKALFRGHLSVLFLRRKNVAMFFRVVMCGFSAHCRVRMILCDVHDVFSFHQQRCLHPTIFDCILSEHVQNRMQNSAVGNQF